MLFDVVVVADGVDDCGYGAFAELSDWSKT